MALVIVDETCVATLIQVRKNFGDQLKRAACGQNIS